MTEAETQERERESVSLPQCLNGGYGDGNRKAGKDSETDRQSGEKIYQLGSILTGADVMHWWLTGESKVKFEFVSGRKFAWRDLKNGND